MTSEILEVIPIGEDSAPDVCKVLDAAKEGNLEFVIVIGQDEEGDWYYASNEGDRYRIAYAADLFKSFIMGNG